MKSYSITSWKYSNRHTYFKEIIDAFYDILKKDHVVTISTEIIPDSINIIFGCNNIQNKEYNIPENSIIVNLEQLYDDSTWIKRGFYLDILKKYQVWDYSLDNIEWLKTKEIFNVKHFKIGKSPAFEYPINNNTVDTKSIDVLFYGSMNNRRREIINKLRKLNYNVVTVNAWGKNREDLINNSRIVLNIHFFSTFILEILRIIPLIANNHFVITETSSYPDNNDEWKENIVTVDYDSIVDTVKYYLNNQEMIPDKVKQAKDFYETLEFVLPIT